MGALGLLRYRGSFGIASPILLLLVLATLAPTTVGPSASGIGVPPRAGAEIWAPSSSVAPLAITNVSVSPSATEVVSTDTTINVSVSGGSPPYTYWYAGLPQRCLSRNTSSLFCFPISVGVFDVVITVNDTLNASVNSTVRLTITSGYGGPPRINSVYEDPSPVKVDQKTLIYVNATSESSTPESALGFAYFYLPPGCASFNQTPLECIPTQAGTYHILVRVTDGFGDFTQATTTMNVTGGPAGSSAGPLSLGSAVTYGTVCVVILLLVIAVAIFLRGRRKRGPMRQYDPSQ